MIGYLKLGAIALAVLAAVGTGAFVKGCSYGEDKGLRTLAAHQAAWREEHAKQVAATDRIQREWDRITGERDGLQKKFDAAAARGAALADRLRQHARRGQCAVPEVAAAPAGADEAAGESSLDARIESVTRRIGAACAAEAEQLIEVLARYNAAVEAQ